MSIANITPHFTWSEARCHERGSVIPLEAQPHIRRVAAMLERIRARFGGPLVPVSWYRTPSWNVLVGGAVHSRHMVGDAVDMRPADITDLVGLRSIIESMLRDGELPDLGGLGWYPGCWIHVDCRPRPDTGHVAYWTGDGVGSEAA